MPLGIGGWRWTDALRSLHVLNAVWSVGFPAVNSGVGVAYRTLFTTLQRLVVGREMTVQLGEYDVTLTVTEFHFALETRALSVGQLGNVRIAARDMRWDEHVFHHATATLHNVHFLPGIPPVLVAAPVDLWTELPAQDVEGLIRKAAPGLDCELRPDGTAHLRWARRRGIGYLEVELATNGSMLSLQPRAVVVGRKRFALPTRTPAYPLGLPDLPHGLLITGLSFDSGSLQLSGLLPEWRMELPLKPVEDIISRLGERAGPLTISWPALRRSAPGHRSGELP